MVYICNGILFSLQIEGNSAMDGFNMDEPWGLYSKQNKPVIKRQISVWFNLYKSRWEREGELNGGWQDLGWSC